MRAAALGKDFGSNRETVAVALRRVLPIADITWMQPSSGPRFLNLARLLPTLARLLLGRPRLVIAEGTGVDALAAAIYRVLAPSSRLLLCGSGDAATRRARFVLSRADDVAADGEPLVRAIERLRLPQAPFQPAPLPADLELFLAGSVHREPAAAHRLLYVGRLSPESGAADALAALAAWAEQHPEHHIELSWAGDGDLAAVLAAQPLLANLEQRFLGDLDRPALAAACADAGILLMPLGEAEPEPPVLEAPVLEAMAAGLVLLGNRRTAAVRRAARAGAPIWAFDALNPRDIAATLSLALDADADELDAMREAGRALVLRAWQEQGQALRGTLPPVLPPQIAPGEAYP